jgi:excinuclease ABC subunit A
MKNADYIVDIGPGAGVHGGEVVAQGTLEQIMAEPSSITGSIFRQTAYPGAQKAAQGQRAFSYGSGAAENNLKEIDVSIPWVPYLRDGGIGLGEILFGQRNPL